eukprot:GDKJ01050267.1.p1 GENE.GDKJ01050267.1~~GDKJ01050267.1.p1  ORF type:complete len:384 (-),score=42.38 GDKJ01050267.1:2803-3954(-)
MASERIVKAPRYSYQPVSNGAVGKGSFGEVTLATRTTDGTSVAIKKVLQDPRYKNREMDIMLSLHHPNIVEVTDTYFVQREGDANAARNGLFLCIVMEYIPHTLHRMIKAFHVESPLKHVPPIIVKVYMYQLCRGLAYIHRKGYCHRDIKPQNILVDDKTHAVKICDFGSAKQLVATEPSISYICSRYYRAPELILQSKFYTNAIDMWSIGCVMGEMMFGQPIFAGETSVDQLVRIIQTMGTPTQEEVSDMNCEFQDFSFPVVRVPTWEQIFTHHCGKSQVPPDPHAMDFFKKLLCFSPKKRLTPNAALAHPYFDELREPGVKIPNLERTEMKPLPPLFNYSIMEHDSFTAEEREIVVPKYLAEKITAKLEAYRQMEAQRARQ